MAITLGKDVVSSYTGITNDNIRNITITDEAETVETTARGSKGWKEFVTTFTTSTIEIECNAHTLSIGDTVGAMEVLSISTNEPLDDIVTYNITLKPKST